MMTFSFRAYFKNTNLIILKNLAKLRAEAILFVFVRPAVLFYMVTGVNVLTAKATSTSK